MSQPITTRAAGHRPPIGRWPARALLAALSLLVAASAQSQESNGGPLGPYVIAPLTGGAATITDMPGLKGYAYVVCVQNAPGVTSTSVTATWVGSSATASTWSVPPGNAPISTEVGGVRSQWLWAGLTLDPGDSRSLRVQAGGSLVLVQCLGRGYGWSVPDRFQVLDGSGTNINACGIQRASSSASDFFRLEFPVIPGEGYRILARVQRNSSGCSGEQLFYGTRAVGTGGDQAATYGWQGELGASAVWGNDNASACNGDVCYASVAYTLRADSASSIISPTSTVGGFQASNTGEVAFSARLTATCGGTTTGGTTTGGVNPPIIHDDTLASGSGSWLVTSSGSAYGGSYQQTSVSGQVYTANFNSLAAGSYTVQIAYPLNPTSASQTVNVAWSATGGAGSAVLNERNAAAGSVYGGVSFQTMGTVIVGADGNATVTITSGGNTYTYIDAIALVPLSGQSTDPFNGNGTLLSSGTARYTVTDLFLLPVGFTLRTTNGGTARDDVWQDSPITTPGTNMILDKLSALLSALGGTTGGSSGTTSGSSGGTTGLYAPNLTGGYTAPYAAPLPSSLGATVFGADWGFDMDTSLGSVHVPCNFHLVPQAGDASVLGTDFVANCAAIVPVVRNVLAFVLCFSWCYIFYAKTLERTG